jgi:hypothetical protein
MFHSDSTCCVCRERGKATQIHHIDEDPSNNAPVNLAVLCLECHNQTQVKGGFGRKLTDSVLTKYRDEWLTRVVQRRDEADRLAVQEMAGAVGEPSQRQIETLLSPENHKDAILRYVQGLPDLRLELRNKARPGWSGTTADMVNASYKYIDALHAVLVRLSGFYPRGSFGEDSHRFFSDVIALHFRWHHAHAEPDGPGTGGTIVNVLCSGNVIGDTEKMVEDMVLSLLGYGGRLDWKDWLSRWQRDNA